MLACRPLLSSAAFSFRCSICSMCLRLLSSCCSGGGSGSKRKPGAEWCVHDGVPAPAALAGGCGHTFIWIFFCSSSMASCWAALRAARRSSRSLGATCRQSAVIRAVLPFVNCGSENLDTWLFPELHPLWLSPFPVAAAQCGPLVPSSSSAAPPPGPAAQPPGGAFVPAMTERPI